MWWEPGQPVNDDLHADIEDADFLLLFPLKGERRWRLVGTVHDLPAGEHGNLSFDDVKGKAMEHLKLNIEKVNWFSTYRVHHRVADRFRDRRAFLLGDAAHVHSPVGGQGMNTGIGDAVNLAWKLAAVLKQGASEKLLDTYEPERIAFARRLVATTDRGFAFVTKRVFSRVWCASGSFRSWCRCFFESGQCVACCSGLYRRPRSTIVTAH